MVFHDLYIDILFIDRFNSAGYEKYWHRDLCIARKAHENNSSKQIIINKARRRRHYGVYKEIAGTTHYRHYYACNVVDGE